MPDGSKCRSRLCERARFQSCRKTHPQKFELSRTRRKPRSRAHSQREPDAPEMQIATMRKGTISIVPKDPPTRI
jgi:hypothetical protein